MTLATGTQLGRYEIRSKIGEGGMGEVYLAEDKQLGRRVAIKLLPPETSADEKARKRLVREARAAATLDHPNICSVYEVGEADGRSFIAMQYIEGETLDARIKGKPLDLRESLTIASQIADALAEAHAHGIVHRDIKPGNIMITSRGQAKVMDFGLSKVISKSQVVESEVETETLLSTPGAIMGTVPYMSPEQVKGKALDGRSDIFSFGVMLYEMLSGQQPFAGESSAATASAILTREPPPLARYSREIPGELERIVSKALRKDREERYQVIKDMLLDLKTLKQELEFEAKLGLSGAPPDRQQVPSVAAAGGQVRGTAEESVERTAPASASVSVLSGGLLATIRRYKLAALATVLAIIVVGVALAFYLRTNNSRVAIDSIAVLPFENQNHDPDTEYLSDGITDSLINNLSQLPSLKVMSRNSVFHYKGKETDARAVGRELGVQAVLTGRLVQRGDGLAISLELVNASDNSHIWGAQYNRKLSDLMAVPGDISQEVTENLRLKLSGEEKQRLAKRHTNNPEAYQAYLKGRYYSASLTPSGFEKGIEYFNRAIAIEPNYAQAYAGLAHAYAELPFFADLPPQEALLKARRAARRALELDETIAEAHLSLATINLYYDWDWPAAEREYRRAIELSPGDAVTHQNYGWYLGWMGRFDESLTELKRAQALDPLSTNINIAIGANYYWSGQYDRAIEQYRKVIELDPNVGGLTRIYLGEAYLKQRKFPEAIAEIQKAGQFGVTQSATLGYAYAVSGNRAEAEKVLNELRALSAQKYVPPFTIALIYAGLGDNDQAFAWLEKAYVERSGWLSFLKVDPKFDSLRSDPRFADLVRRVGL